MIIPDALAQQIVESAQAIIRCNVNIMDREGIIIGTAQPERQRTFHKGARDVIISGEAVEIRPEDVDRYPGSLAGVNLPIVLEDKVIGVIGVTGDPNTVRGSAKLIKMITELILERELSHQEMHSRKRLVEQFVEMLLGGGDQYRSRIVRAAKALDIDLDIPRFVLVADVSRQPRDGSSENGYAKLVLEHSFEAILDRLTISGAIGPQDVAVILDGRLVILKSIGQTFTVNEIRKWGKCMIEDFEAWSLGQVTCGAGAVALSLDEYPLSYSQARFCLRTSPGPKAFLAIQDSSPCVAYLMKQVCAGPAAMIFRPLAKALKAAMAKKPGLRKTLEALTANNFECEQTAFALGIHRNTLAYRMARLREATGLDPAKCLDDAILLKMLLME